MRLAPSQGFTGSRDDSALLRTFPFLIAIGLIAISGCAERGTGPPRIDRLGSAMSDLRGDSIRVATANLWGVSAFGIDWADEIDARFAAFAERLGRNEPGLDLVLIQEAWKDEARRGMLAHRGVIENFPHRVDALEQPGGAGLVVLSRFPIERAEFHRFRTQGRCFKFWEGDCLSGKGVLAVQVRIEERLFWVASTHLIACYSGDDEAETACDQWDPNGDARWSQLVEARQFMEELTGEAPALLGGDFNLTRSSRYYPGMTSETIPPDPLDAKVREQAQAKVRVTTKESSDQRAEGWRESGERETVAQRIDYIWTRSGARDRWQVGAPARLIFTDPVELASGESIAISDHPILAIPFCLVGRSAGSESTICKTHRP